MKKFLPIVLGTNINSYQLARSIYEEYGVNPVICDHEIKTPFVNSIYNNLFIEKDIKVNNTAFIDILNKIHSYNKESFDKFIVFAPHESYLNILCKNKDKLDFEIVTPYKQLGDDFTNKDKFYELLDKLNYKYPKSIKISDKNFDLNEFNDDLFIRPMDMSKYIKINFDGKENSYRVDSKDKAIEIINKIIDNSYDGQILVQEYIAGKDGNQFSINGYRATNSKIYMVQSRSILTDDIGNPMVQIDSNIPELYNISKNIIEKMDYTGYFNIDYKISDYDGNIYITAINTRLGNTFYYSNLAGINLIKLSINDLILNDKIEDNFIKKRFGINLFKDELTNHFITSGLFLEYKDNERAKNTINLLYDEKDLEHERYNIINSYVEDELNNRKKSIGN